MIDIIYAILILILVPPIFLFIVAAVLAVVAHILNILE